MDMQPRALPTYRYTSTRCYVTNSNVRKSVHLLLGQTTYSSHSHFKDRAWLNVILTIYFTYISVNTTIKDYRFVYSYMFWLNWVIFRLWLEPHVFTRYLHAFWDSKKAYTFVPEKVI